MTDKSVGNGNILAGSINRFRSIKEIDFIDQEVFEGFVYSISKRLAIGASAVINIVIDPTACTCEDLFYLPSVFKAYGAGPINVDFYYGPTVTAATGTAWNPTNRNGLSAKTSDLVVLLNPTVTDPGTKSDLEFVVLSDGTAAVATTGGEAKESFLSVADKSIKYMFRLTNVEAVQAAGYVGFDWIEIP